MAARGKPFAFAAPLVALGLAVAFGAVLLVKRAPKNPAPGADPRLAQVELLVQTADAAELTGNWTGARKALEAAVALAPDNPQLAARLQEAREEEQRQALVKKAEEARESGDAAAEAAALAEARRIREEEELKARQREAEAKDLAARGAESEKAGDLVAAEQFYRESLKVREAAEVKAALDGVQKKIADVRREAAAKDAEAKGAEGIAACSEGRVEAARAALKAALAIEDRKAWRDKLQEVEERATASEAQLELAQKLYEKKDLRGAKDAARRATGLNRENKAAEALLARISAEAVRTGMVRVESCRVKAGGGDAAVAAFWIDAREVTDAQWREFVRAEGARAPRYWAEGRFPGDGSGPVMGISAQEAEAYARWAGKRLPTEAEWLAAAGAADGRAYPWGSEWDAAKANAKSDGPRPAGSLPAGAAPCGALDLAGNVAEWTATLEGDRRVVKGGGFLFPTDACRLDWRWLEHEDLPFAGIGFRCAADGE